MEKQPFQDVVPRTERTVRRIPLNRPSTSSRSSSRAPSEPVQHIPIHVQRHIPVPPQDPPRHFEEIEKPRGGGKKLLKGLGVVALIIALLVVGTIYFGRVIVSITPKHSEVKIDNIFSAVSNPDLPGIHYVLASTSASLSEVVPATPGGVIQTKAKGRATIINASSLQPQQLVASTRLQATNGRIYRIDSAVTVPAAREVGGKLTPGKVDVAITADQYGDTYNASLTDVKEKIGFTIPGFKGSAKFSIFTAEQSSDISGGFSGVKNTVSTAVSTAAAARIQSKITETLLENVRAIASTSYILYDKSYVIEFERLPDISKGSTSSEIRYIGRLYAPLFESMNLTANIAKTEVSKMGGPELVESEGIRDIIFSAREAGLSNLKREGSIAFTLRGTVGLTSKIPAEQLINDLRGLPLTQSNAVFAKYIGIASADIRTVPGWLRTFPDSNSRIEIEVNR